MARSARQIKLLDIIAKRDIETQEALASALISEGFKVTQATISRDIKELGLIKVMTPDKRYKYAQPSMQEHSGNLKLINLFKESVLSIEASQNIIVIKTLIGAASTSALLIDKMNISEIMGCVAGDDTIILVVRHLDLVEEVLEKLNNVMI